MRPTIKTFSIVLLALLLTAAATPRILALCDQGDDETRVDCLISALKDGDPKVRQRAASLLMRHNFRKPRAVPALAEALKDEDAKVRQEAAKSLGWYGPAASEALPALTEALQDQDRWVQIHAKSAISRIENLGAEEDTSAMRQRMAQESKEARDQHDLELAMKQISGSCHPRFTTSALITLMRLKEKARPAVPEIIKTLSCDDMAVRAYAVRALGGIAPPEQVMSYIIGALEDEKSMVRRAAAETLGAMGPAGREAVPNLIKALGDKDWRVNEALVESLGLLGDESAVGPLVKLIGSDIEGPSFQVRKIKKAAVKALEKIGTPKALEAVETYKMQ